MDNLKFILVSIISITLVGLGGYWAVKTIQSGSEYVNIQKIKKLESDNTNLKQEVTTLNNQITQLQTSASIQKPAEVPAPVPIPTPKPKPKTSTTTTKKTTKKTTTKTPTKIVKKATQ